MSLCIYASRNNDNKLINILDHNKKEIKEMGSFVCPSCGKRLIPCMGSKKEWYFRHKVEDGVCSGASYMSVTHKLACQLFLEEELEIKTDDMYVPLNLGGKVENIKIHDAVSIKTKPNECKSEFVLKDSALRTDIAFKDTNGTTYLFEINVHHRKSQEDILKLLKSGIQNFVMIEITLPDLEYKKKGYSRDIKQYIQSEANCKIIACDNLRVFNQLTREIYASSDMEKVLCPYYDFEYAVDKKSCRKCIYRSSYKDGKMTCTGKWGISQPSQVEYLIKHGVDKLSDIKEMSVPPEQRGMRSLEAPAVWGTCPKCGERLYPMVGVNRAVSTRHNFRYVEIKGIHKSSNLPVNAAGVFCPSCDWWSQLYCPDCGDNLQLYENRSNGRVYACCSNYGGAEYGLKDCKYTFSLYQDNSGMKAFTNEFQEELKKRGSNLFKTSSIGYSLRS